MMPARYGPLPGNGGGSARIRSAARMLTSRLNGPLTRPLLSMSARRLPNRSGSASAASTTAAIFSTVRPEHASERADLVGGARRLRNFRTLAAFAHARLGGGPLDRLKRPSNRVDLAWQEVLAKSVLGKLAANDLL